MGSSLDVLDREEPKFQIRSYYEIPNAIIATYKRYNDCCFLHSTIPALSGDELQQILYGKENLIIQQPNSIGHCISADAEMSKGFADFLSHRIPGLRPTHKKNKTLHSTSFPLLGFYWQALHLQPRDKRTILQQTRLIYSFDYSRSNEVPRRNERVSTIAIPKIGCGMDKMNWLDVVELLRDVFAYSDIHVVVYTLESHGVHAMSSEGDLEFYAHDEKERYSEDSILARKI